MAGEVLQQPEAEADARRRALVADVRAGLSARPMSLPPKYLYDDLGSRLFDEITRQPEYYPTRTEETILEARAEEIIARVQPAELVELGSGVGRKVRLLLDAMRRADLLQACVMIDINASFLAQSVARLNASYPGMTATGLHGDFLEDLSMLGPGGQRLLILLAGTIGNIPPTSVPAFLSRVAALLAPGDAFLVGFDLVKDVARLEAAYNDAAGVTAAFNRNVLAMLNRELDADFVPEQFAHVARWDQENSWIDIRLRSDRDQRVRIAALDMELDLARGEEIRTEISAKYTRDSVEGLLGGTGLGLARWFTDADELFALALFEPR